MNKKAFCKGLSVIIAVIMLMSLIPSNVLAAWVYNEQATTDAYYKLISQRYWQLAPGIQETEVVINNSQGTRRQVVHSVSVDLNNPYNDVIPGYKNMNPTIGNFGVEVTSTQALNAEKLGYGNVVAATNAMLSWYTSAYYQQHPEYIGQPLGWNICNGYYYENSQGPLGDMSSAYAVLVINYDKHPITGEPRPDNIPKVQMRGIAEPLTGWEKNAISAWQWLVKPDANGNPVLQFGTDHGSGIASRTFMGIKADGTFVVSVSDGDQAPYSTGFTMYEMAEYMVKMGCIAACNCDGGGSTTLCTQRPGEDLKVNCSLSDGGERPTTNTVLIISNAPADGELSNATISTDYEYYTPGSTVEFSAIGIDASGAKVDIPSDVEWRIAEDGMGSISNGVFTSNGTEGTVTAQMIYKDKVVGERKINIATPDAISLNQPVVTIPYGKTAKIPIKATVNNGLHEIGLGENDITFETDNTAIGTFNGMSFTAVEEANAPENTSSNVTATLNIGTNPTINFQLNLGKGSEVLFDFEGGQSDINEWNIIDNRKGTVWDYDMHLSLADKTNGEVHDGNYSMRMELNGLSSNASHSAEYGWIRLGVNDLVELENARSLGFWLYIPEDVIHLWVCGNYMADSDGDGVYDSYANPGLPPAFPNQVYEKVDESGWYYLKMDLSQYERVALKEEKSFNGSGTAKNTYFLQFIFARAKQNDILANGTTIAPYTFYFDNFTVDYSDAVDDREKPEFDKIYMDGTALVKRETATTTSNTLTFTANVADATARVDANKVAHPLTTISGIDADSAKVTIDGVEVPASYSGGVMTASNVTVKDGYHRVRFEITDNAGNTAVMIRTFKVESGNSPASVIFEPADKTLDRLLFGSVYWMNLKTKDIENIKSVETVIDMNAVNHWQLDNMELAEGFTASYTVDADSNAASITFTRTGDSDKTGEAILAKIPVRILDYDNDIHVSGKTAAQYWASHEFWGHDLKLDVDKGLITFVDGSKETFSNEEFSVDTEMYTPRYYMDATYLSEHGSTHIHTVTPLADKAPTCTENGYTGRTFCEVCNSVVDWGTTIPATGHTYGVVGDKLACHCGKEITGTGIKTVNGKKYYLMGGTLVSGWRLDESADTSIDTSKYTGVEINTSLVTNTDNWYYFDENTYEGINGTRTFTINGVKVDYNFVDGAVEGLWKADGSGSKYYYGPDYAKYIKRSQLSNFTWVAINGEIYAFDANSHRYEGYAVLVNTGGDAVLCEFDENGVLVGRYSPSENYTGIFRCTTKTTYLRNGIPVNAGLVKDGDDYYYVASGYEAVVGNYDVTRTNGLLLPGFYQFGEDGKMINPPVYPDGPNSDGSFYLNGKKLVAYQLVEFDGNYYFINDGNKYAKNTRLYLAAKFADAFGLPVGYYDFDKTGKLFIKNGPFEDGFFYLNNVKQTSYKLIEFEGNYYFIDSGNKYAKDKKVYLSETFVKGTGLAVGYYYFDNTGKMSDNDPSVKNGPNEDGFFYLNDVKQKSYQLIEFEGNYYFINDYNKYAKNTTLYMSSRFADAFGLPVGYYEFDETGKIIMKNGPDADGYFYRNGVRQNAYQLVEFEGNYYFIDNGNKYATSRTVYLSSRFVDEFGLDVGYYEFDETGKIIMKNGPYPDGFFYRNGLRQNAYQLVEFEGNYYFINDYNKYAADKRIYLTARFVDGTGLPVGNYDFDSTGKMILKNGPQDDGYFYINNVKQKAYQLINFEGDYYFINDANKYAADKRIYLSDKFVSGTGLTVGYYDFDSTGKMILKNGPDEDGYFYINNVKQKSYQIINFEGNYYFINDGNKYTKSKTVYLTAKFVEPFGLRVGYYEFDDAGRIIMKNGPGADGYFYLDGTRVDAFQLIKFNGDYYYIGAGNKYVTSRWQYTGMADSVFDGTDIRSWHHSFDNQGRMIGYYEGLPNGRDIGKIWNLKTADGKNIKSGLLIRGCELDNSNYYFPPDIIATGIDRLQNEFHIKTDMDLRSQTVGGLDVFGEDVQHKYYDMALYEEIFTDAGKEKVKEVFTDLANPDNYPIYMHCTHGIDRTGTVSFLLESVLGVERQMLIYEYTLSVGSYGNKIVAVYNSLNSRYTGATFKEKAENYLKSCGITQEQIDTLREIYLED